MLTGIAWRNIWRNRKRSFVILTAIALGLCGGIFATGIMIGMAESMVNTSIDRDLGHLQIHTTSFKENPSVNSFIADGDSVAASVRALPGVKGVEREDGGRRNGIIARDKFRSKDRRHRSKG